MGGNSVIRGVKSRAREASLVFGIFEHLRYYRWLLGGKPVPPPHLAKQLVIEDFARRYRLNVFVETGTYLGDMVWTLRNIFKRLYSIELSDDLYRKAKSRFQRCQNVTLLNGDSGELIKDALAEINEPALFWLDGHYSGGITARGTLETPIKAELKHIFNHSFSGQHVILIDDARCFGAGDYPSIESMKDWAASRGYRHFKVIDDIIRIYA